MSFVQPSGGQGRHVAVGIAVAFHLLLGWGLMNGLGRAVIQAINKPIETTLIEEIKPPPPPPAKVIELPPPPKFTPPPPAFVPPPEVQVAPPPTPGPVIAATAPEPPAAPPPPVAPRVEAPAPPAPPASPAPPAPPARIEASVACSNYGKVMGDAAFPRDAVRAGLEEGSALVQFTLGPTGEIKDVKALQATHPAFARGATRIVAEYRCAGQGQDVVVQVPFTFRSN